MWKQVIPERHCMASCMYGGYMKVRYFCSGMPNQHIGRCTNFAPVYSASSCTHGSVKKLACALQLLTEEPAEHASLVAASRGVLNNPWSPQVKHPARNQAHPDSKHVDCVD